MSKSTPDVPSDSRPFKRRVYTYFDQPDIPGLECKDASLTRQEFAAESDLNNIMRRYADGLGQLPSGDRPPIFGDFDNVPDYQSALDKVIDAQDRFMQLPSAVRKRFDNDPGKLLEFLSSEDNRKEAVELGLIPAPPVKEEVSVPDEGAK